MTPPGKWVSEAIAKRERELRDCLRVDCPQCGAPSTLPCATPGGHRLDEPHIRRVAHLARCRRYEERIIREEFPELRIHR